MAPATTLLLLPLLALSCALAGGRGGPLADKALIYYSHGTDRLIQGDYTGAIRVLSQAHDLRPGDARVNNNLGMAYRLKGDRGRALHHLGRAVDLDGGDMDARNNLASVLLEAGDLEGAMREYRVVEADLGYESRYRTFYNMALIHRRRGDDRGFVEYLGKSLAENRDYCPASLQLALRSYGMGDHAEALGLLRDASMGPCYRHPEPHYYTALALLRLGDAKAAEEKLVEIQEMFRETPYAAMAGDELRRAREARRGGGPADGAGAFRGAVF